MWNEGKKHNSFSRAVLGSFLTQEELDALDKKYDESKHNRKIKRQKSITNFCPHCGKSLTKLKLYE